MTLRKQNLSKLHDGHFDVFIVGAGINGAVCAAALAAKGLKVAVVDKNDFASGTSSQSSYLIWGGIKYLENHEYGLVNKLCKARNQLMRRFPSQIREVRFLTTIEKGFRHPPFFIYLGTLLYWAFGRFFTRAPEYLTSGALAKRETAIDMTSVAGGFEYSDAYLPDGDARFVFDFVRSAHESGAVTANYVEVMDAQKSGQHWTLRLQDNVSQEQFNVTADAVINACGPFLDAFNAKIGKMTQHSHLLSKGIHLIVDRVTDAERVLAFFAADGRLFFVLPLGHKTCIGTTDTHVTTPTPEVTEEDRRFILDNANDLLRLSQPLTEKDIISERCGVRPLAVAGDDEQRDWVAISRKHVIDVDEKQRYLSIFGGKLTDCVNVGEEVVDLLADMSINAPRPDEDWFGEANKVKRDAFFQRAAALGLEDIVCRYSQEDVSERFWRRYGERAHKVLDEIENEPNTMVNILKGIDFFECELPLVAETEMVTHLDDFLRRRTNIALVRRYTELVNDPRLQSVCKTLFGDDWLQEYQRFCP